MIYAVLIVTVTVHRDHKDQ